MTASTPTPPPHHSSSELKTRLITGGALSALTLFLVWFGLYPFCSLVVFFSIIGHREFQRFAEQKGFSPSARLGLLMNIMILGSAILFPAAIVTDLMLLGLILTFTIMLLRPHKRVSAMLDSALTVLGIIYVGWFFSFIIQLRKMPDGAALITLLLVGSAFNDMGGYFVGRKFGRIKLYPRVSPKKTVEGALGGVVTAILACLFVGFLTGICYNHCMIAALIIATAGSFGDLFESSLKRDVGVKDSGNAIPGHGGALDRFDSLAFAAPIFYLYAIHFML